MDLSILSGPIIGAIIGYGTNWIAIKMLFRPLKPIKIGRFVMPFTPGIIPKRKNKLAKAIGDSVGNNLFTKTDMQEMLLSEEIENLIVDNILSVLESEKTVKNIFSDTVGEEEYAQGRESLKLLISEKIKYGLIKAEVGNIIAIEGKNVIDKKVKGSMLRMFVTEDLINSIVEPMGDEIEKYIKEHGQEKIIPIVEKEVSSLESESIKKLTQNIIVDKEKIEKLIKEIYRKVILKYVNPILEKLDVSKVVEDKVNDMNVLELEKILLSIMQKELGAVVNLGAVIGLVLGTVNIFV